MNCKEIFSSALGLQSPWKLNNVEFTKQSNEKILRIEIGFEKGARFADPEDGSLCKVHDAIERRWQHLNFFEHTCYIYCRVPRIRTKAGNVKKVEVPWARAGSGFSLLFEAYSMLLIESEMPVNRVG